MLYESSYYGIVQFGDVIEHHGILGMKWGVRRYQNKDGTLTAAGMKRYNTNRAGKPGKATLTRHTAKMYEKYGLLEPNPSKDQAWDNAFDMIDKGATDKEVKRYLKEVGVPLEGSDFKKAFARKAKQDVEKTYQVKENAQKLAPAYKKYRDADKKFVEHEENFAKKVGTKEFEKYFERGLEKRVDPEAEDLKEICRQELKAYTSGEWKVNPRNIGGFTFAYDEYNLDHPKEYSSIVDRWQGSRDAFDSKCRSAAEKSYKQKGNKAMKNWCRASGEDYHNTKKDDIKLIDHLIYEECRKQYEQGKK